MRGGTRRLGQFAAAGVIVVVTAVGLYLVARSPHRADLEGFAGLAISVVGVAAGWIAWVWRPRSRQASGIVSGPELEGPADLLAVAVGKQWKEAAGGRGLLEPALIPVRWQRPGKPVAGPPADAAASKQFAPLPGIAAVNAKRLRAGQVGELHQLYGGLGSGRLVITGKAGSGKSGAAVLLILAALDHRRSLSDSDRAHVPVPVMFTFHGWDPSNQKAHDWLAERLSQTYPMLEGRRGRGTAGSLLSDGRIAVILDGLDEIPKDMRPVALKALSQQATFRLILLTRSDEMAEATEHEILQGAAAIELQDIDARTAAAYLKRTQPHPPPQGWHKLISYLPRQSDSPLAQALKNPLMLTMVRDTYHPGDDAGELLDLCGVTGHAASSEDITNHLLDRVLPTAYAQQPGEPPPVYDGDSAERALQHIAARMNADGTRDLQWWQVPDWARAGPRGVATGLVFGLGYCLVVGLVFGLWWGLLAGLVSGLWTGIGAGLEAMLPRQMAPVRWRRLLERRPLVNGLALWLILGLVFALLRGLKWGLVAGLVFGLLLWLVAGGMQQATDDTSPPSPLASWRSDRAFGFWWGLANALIFGLVSGLFSEFRYGYGLEAGPPAGDSLRIGLTLGLVIGLVAWFMYSVTWVCSLAFVQLARSDGTPVRLIRFLEDARKRNVLRTVGPIYQFRHARLQDWLADKESATAPDPLSPVQRQ